MRHGNKINHLSRKYGHRASMLSNMAASLILHKRIFTTTAKAKELKGFIEPLITKAKGDSTHSRRVVFSYLQDKDSLKELFGTVAEKVADRPGGYTRILKTHRRFGDNAEMCMIELVDFNELMLEQKVAKKSDSTAAKRTRRGKKKGDEGAVAAAPVVAKAAKVVEAITEDVVVDEVAEVEEIATEVEEIATEVEEVAVEVEEVVSEAEATPEAENHDTTDAENSESEEPKEDK